MSLSQETRSIQSQLARFCRDGKTIELPGVKAGRIGHYRRLIMAILFENLEAAFPITYKYTDNETWSAMVHKFFKDHNCQSYQVWSIAGEFCDHAIRENFAEIYKIPYLNDLLKFEWEEMCVYNMEDLEIESHGSTGAFLTDQIIFNPEHKIIPLQYPIHIFDPLEASSKMGRYFVLLYRDPQTGNVQFIDLSIWFAVMIEQINLQKATLQDLINQAPDLFGSLNLEHLTVETLNFLEELRKRRFLLGFRKQNH